MPGIAESVGMGYANFRRAFTEYFGMSPIQYQIRTRVEEARRLLHTGRRTIKEVSEMLGYADQYTFSKQFKKYAGVTPFDLARGPRPA